MKSVSLICILVFLFTCSLVGVAEAAVDSDWRIESLITLPSAATSFSYSSDGTLIAVGHANGSVTIWEIKTGKLLSTLKAHEKEVNTVQFASTGSFLVTIGDDNRARVWSTKDWSEKGSIDGVAFSGAVSPDGRWLAGQDAKQTICIWDMATLKKIKELTESGKGGTKNMSFSADGKYLATPFSHALLINVETKQPLELVAAGDKKTPVKIEQTGKDQFSFSLGKLQDDDAITHSVATSRTSALVALGRGWYGQPSFVDVWDISAMKRLGRYKPKDSGVLASFSFDNALVAIEGGENATIWNIANNKKIATVKGGGLVQFSPTSIELAVTDENKLVFYVPKS
jgi:WD40 repeat protein